VVGDKIEHLPHPVRAQFGDPSVVILARTDRVIQLVVIGNFVAMEALRPGLKIGRGITVADPERVKVGHESARLSKGELAVELKSVSRSGNARMRLAHDRATLGRNSRNEQDLHGIAVDASLWASV
jgi:hypothetical protein